MLFMENWNIMFHCCFTLSLVLKPIFKSCQLYISAWPCIAMTIQQVAAMTMSKISFSGCGDGIVRGVNLGGWLVLEPWITPRFFEEVKYQISEGININVCSKHLSDRQVNVGENLDKIVDEWTYAQFLDHETYMERMVGSLLKLP